MGTIQNSVNSLLGSAAGAATLGKHISNQNKELNLKKFETEEELKNVKNDITYEQAKEEADNKKLVGPMPDRSKETQEQFLDRKAEQLQNEMNKSANEGNSSELEKAYTAFKRLKELRDAKQSLQFKFKTLGGKEE